MNTKMMVLMAGLMVLVAANNARAQGCDGCTYVGYAKIVDSICVESDGDISAGNCARVSGTTTVENGISHQVIESWNYYCDDVESNKLFGEIPPVSDPCCVAVPGIPCPKDVPAC